MARENRDRAPRGELPRHRPRLREAGAEGVGRQPRRLAEHLSGARGRGFERRRVGVELGEAAKEIEKERREFRVAVEGNRAGQHGFFARTIRRGA